MFKCIVGPIGMKKKLNSLILSRVLHFLHIINEKMYSHYKDQITLNYKVLYYS